MTSFPVSGWRQWLPCTVTMMALLSGFISIILIINGIELVRPALIGSGCFFILLAWMFDSLDGAIARKVKGTSAFGAELDTFVDFLSFSVAPAILVYAVTLNDYPIWLRLTVPSIMVLSGAVRLSRFRVADSDRGLKGYTGLPVTLIAGFITLWIMLMIPGQTLALPDWSQWVLLFSALLAAFLQVSGIHYPAPTKKPVYMIAALILLTVYGALWAAGSPVAKFFGLAMIVIGYGYSVIYPFICKKDTQKRLVTILIPIWILMSTVFPLSGQNEQTIQLKALLVVGHQEDGTKDAVNSMNKIADLFEKNGVAVYKFYDYDARWDEIIKVSGECNFFVYSGHGSTMGENGNVGGICVTSMISTAGLISSLRLKNNAIVLFKSVCNGAGSSAGDDGDIGIGEARKRVYHYAYPFFKIGASAYYANNYSDGILDFLTDFFEGMTLKQAFLKSTQPWTDVEFEDAFPGDPKMSYSIASSKGSGTLTRTSYINGVKKVVHIPAFKQYEIAYAGHQGFSIKEMK